MNYNTSSIENEVIYHIPMLISNMKNIINKNIFKHYIYFTKLKYIKLHFGCFHDVVKSPIYPVGYCRSGLYDGIGISNLYLCHKNNKEVDTELSLIILCHEMGHVVNFLNEYNGDFIFYNSRFFIDELSMEVMAWYHGYKLFKNISNNRNKWYNIRKILLNSYKNKSNKNQLITSSSNQSRENFIDSHSFKEHLIKF